METVDQRLIVLERCLRHTQVALALILISLAATALAGFSRANAGTTTERSTVLRLRGLVIEDDQGRPRMLLGAPTPQVTGRKRREGVDGIVLLGPDRVAVGQFERRSAISQHPHRDLIIAFAVPGKYSETGEARGHDQAHGITVRIVEPQRR